MKFINDDFLLKGDISKILYHEYAKKMPIIDYHCHIDAKDIAVDTKFKNITQLWIANDHYKWTALRANGIEERYITGNATDEEKFMSWAETLPYLI